MLSGQSLTTTATELQNIIASMTEIRRLYRGVPLAFQGTNMRKQFTAVYSPSIMRPSTLGAASAKQNWQFFSILI